MSQVNNFSFSHFSLYSQYLKYIFRPYLIFLSSRHSVPAAEISPYRHHHFHPPRDNPLLFSTPLLTTPRLYSPRSRRPGRRMAPARQNHRRRHQGRPRSSPYGHRSTPTWPRGRDEPSLARLVTDASDAVRNAVAATASAATTATIGA